MSLDEIKQLFATHQIEKVKLGGFDVDGVLRGKYVSLDKFWSSAESGLGFCDVIFGWDSSDALYDIVRMTGWHTGYPDGVARVDLASFRVLPWEPDTAIFLVDIFHKDGRPHHSKKPLPLHNKGLPPHHTTSRHFTILLLGQCIFLPGPAAFVEQITGTAIVNTRNLLRPRIIYTMLLRPWKTMRRMKLNTQHSRIWCSTTLKTRN